MPFVNRTKVVATVGPACRDRAMLTALIDEGVDVFRLNFSHGTLDDHAAALAGIRAAADARGATVAILGDLCGPKIRLQEVEGDAVDIADGASIAIEAGTAACTAERLCTTFDGLVDDVRPGHRVLIDDGQIRLRAAEKHGRRLICTCETGGTIRSRKGVNLPDTAISMPSLTDKDRADLAWAAKHDLDYIALSFVRRGDDLRQLRDAMREHASPMRIVSKIERPEAVDRLDEIIGESDVVLVARGDLGVEMDVSSVPLIQKDITRRGALAGKPVIVATQMLQSMVESPTPTRAEVSDVANAILDGADAVMLSAETSVGRYPIEALRVIRGIATETEAFLARSHADSTPRVGPDALRVASAVAHGAAIIAEELNARLVAVWSQTGNTVRLLSKRRLGRTIVGLTPDPRVCRWMAMYYGVQPVLLDHDGDNVRMIAEVDRALTERELADAGDLALIISGTKLCQPGATNTLLVHRVGSADADGGAAPTKRES